MEANIKEFRKLIVNARQGNQIRYLRVNDPFADPLCYIMHPYGSIGWYHDNTNKKH